VTSFREEPQKTVICMRRPCNEKFVSSYTSDAGERREESAENEAKEANRRACHQWKLNTGLRSWA
jgi:hypothetical protein